MAMPSRRVDDRFDAAYQKMILEGRFFEFDEYYTIYKDRYRRSLQRLVQLPLPQKARILEIGGGQMALLCHELYGDDCTVADISDAYADNLKQAGLNFVVCDLLHDPLPDDQQWDLIIMLEVVEHLPTPLHHVLEKVSASLAPGGHVFMTTPNLYRFRNLVRFATGREVFAPWFFPERGQFVGHVIEYDPRHLRYHMERAGLDAIDIDRAQLINRGATWKTDLLRRIASPLLLRPLWRDSLVASGRKPREGAA